jgi:hypothetical protein
MELFCHKKIVLNVKKIIGSQPERPTITIPNKQTQSDPEAEPESRSIFTIKYPKCFSCEFTWTHSDIYN